MDYSDSNQTDEKAQLKTEHFVWLLRLYGLGLTKFLNNVPDAIADLNRNT